EFAVAAYWVGRYRDCLDTCERLLGENQMPSEYRSRVEKNAVLARQKLNSATEASDQPRPGSPLSEPVPELGVERPNPIHGHPETVAPRENPMRAGEDVFAMKVATDELRKITESAQILPKATETSRIVVSMTMIRSRLKTIERVLTSILNQSLKP